MLQMPIEASWEAMATLHRNIGLRFIIGLPLNNNNEQLMAAMIRKARQVLPAAAIAGFELGNEPMCWEVCPDVKIGAVSLTGHLWLLHCTRIYLCGMLSQQQIHYCADTLVAAAAAVAGWLGRSRSV
jgi:hypothetical protein